MDSYGLVRFCNPQVYQDAINRAHVAVLSSNMSLEQATATEVQIVEQALEGLRTPEGKYKVTRRSSFTGETNTLELELQPEQIEMWLGGKHIQNAMPQMSAEHREFLMTGITPNEWDETFKNTEE